MTIKQFHAALKKKWPHLNFDPEGYDVWVGDLRLTCDDMVGASTITSRHWGYGDNINDAIEDLKREIREEIRENQEALKQIEEACKKN